MSERGKYHGQRLQAKDVLRLYAAGERDFRGTILQGCNFRGADLSGADFTRADIRSVRFINAELQKTQFCFTKAGCQKPWLMLQIILLMAASFSTGVLHQATFSCLGILFSGFSEDNPIFNIILFSAWLFIASIIFAAYPIYFGKNVWKNGIIDRTTFLACAYFLVVCSIFSFFLNLGDLYDRKASVYVVSSVSLACLSLLYGNIFTSYIFSNHSNTISSIFFFFAFFIYFFVSGYCRLKNSLWENNTLYVYSRGGGLFENVISFFSLGGTSFDGADLTDANLTGSVLKHVRFSSSSRRAIKMTRVRWKNVEGLAWSKLGPVLVKDTRRRKLLTSLDGRDGDFSDDDLTGANLAGVLLDRANLRGANLTESTLKDAELKEANLNRAVLRNACLSGINLTETHCVGTDFTGSELTGACLEAWNTYETTIFKDLKCSYVFLKEFPDCSGVRERLPHDPNKYFEDGDFEKYFRDVVNEVKLLIKGGVDPEAFKEAFQALRGEFGISIQDMQNLQKRGDQMLMTLRVSEGTDKAEVERTWDKAYQAGLQEGYTSGLLQGQTQRADDVKEIALGFSKALSSMQISNQITNMNNPINAVDGGFINTGSMEGNVVNLGELSGQVTVQINQLPDAAPSADQRSLKDLLTELQAAIEAETELSDIEKKEALAEVGKLAEAGSKPQENAMQRVAKRATANLKAIAEPLTEASNLVTVCKSLLPLILALFV